MNKMSKNYETLMRMAGYVADDSLLKKFSFFMKAGLQENRQIPALLLTGAYGAGKTYAAECMAKALSESLGETVKTLFIQMNPDITGDNLVTGVDVASVIRKDADHATTAGILLRALQSSINGPTMVIIDELDKAPKAVDAFLLDWLNSGRLTDGVHEWHRGSGNLWVVITANENRKIDGALANRCRQIRVPMLSSEAFAEALGVPVMHHIVGIYETSGLSIRQAKMYLEDIGYADEMDEDALSMYPDAMPSLFEDRSMLGDAGIAFTSHRYDDETDVPKALHAMVQAGLDISDISLNDGEILVRNWAQVKFCYEAGLRFSERFGDGRVFLPSELVSQCFQMKGSDCLLVLRGETVQTLIGQKRRGGYQVWLGESQLENLFYKEEEGEAYDD